MIRYDAETDMTPDCSNLHAVVREDSKKFSNRKSVRTKNKK